MKRILLLSSIAAILCTAVAFADTTVSVDPSRDRKIELYKKSVEEMHIGDELVAVGAGVQLALSYDQGIYTCLADGIDEGWFSFQLLRHDTDFRDGTELVLNMEGDSNSATFTVAASGDYTMCLWVAADETYSDILAYQQYDFTVTDYQTVDERVAEIVAECPAGTSFDKALWLHDWITNNAKYDLSYSYFGVDGVLLRGAGVCDSYSKAYYKLLTAAGIDCAYVSGGSHAWNAIRINGNWFWVDVTWDDPTSVDEIVTGSEHHFYFGLPDVIMDADHTFQAVEEISDSRLEGFSCTEYESNYFIHTGVLIDSWSSAFISQINAALLSGSTSFSMDLPDFYKVEDGNYSYGDEHIVYNIVAYFLGTLEFQGEEVAFTYEDNSIIAEVIVQDIIANGTCGDNLTWKLASDGTLTIAGTGEMWDFSMPSVNDYTAWSQSLTPGAGQAPWIADYARAIKKIKVKTGVTTIGNGAFAQVGQVDESLGSLYYRLESVSLPGTLTAIHSEAFACTGCETLAIPDGVTDLGGSYGKTFLHSSIEEVILGNGITVLASGLFRDCKYLENVEFGTNLAEIKADVFTNCSSLTVIDLPTGLLQIRANAFYNCNNLEIITVPATVNAIDTYAFNDCPALSSVYFYGSSPNVGNPPIIFERCNITAYYPEGDNTWPSTIEAVMACDFNGSITWIAWEPGKNRKTSVNGTCGDNIAWALSGIEGNLTLTITGRGELPDYMNANYSGTIYTSTPWGSYRNEIRKLIVKDGITRIGDDCFAYLESLSSAELGSTITWLGTSVFSHCYQLEEIVLPQYVTEINDNAFSYCSGLERITIPVSATMYGKDIFAGCGNVTVYGQGGSEAEYCAAENNVSFVSTGTVTTNIVDSGEHWKLTREEGDLVLTIEDESSLNSDEETYKWAAYLYARKIQRIIATGDCNSVEAGFCSSYFASLESVRLPSTVTEIQGWSFAYCPSLRSIEIPASVTYIGNDCFSNSPVLCIYGISGSYAEEYANLQGFTFVAMNTIPETADYILPESVTIVEEEAFAENGQLKTIKLGESVTYVASNAFNGTGLETIIVPSSATVFAADAFGNTNPVIMCIVGSNAEAFARKYGYTYQFIAIQ